MKKLAYKAFLWLVDWIFGPKWEEYDMNGHLKLRVKLPTGIQFRLPGMRSIVLSGEVDASKKALADMMAARPWGDAKKAMRAMLADLKAHYFSVPGRGGFFFARNGKDVPYLEYWTQRVWGLINLIGRPKVVDDAFDGILRPLQGVPWPVDFDALSKAIERMPERAADDPRESFIREISGVMDAAENIVAGKTPITWGETMASVEARLADYHTMTDAVKQSRNLKELTANLVAAKKRMRTDEETIDEWIDVCKWLSAE